jgi:hypothetical protein
MHHGIIPLLYRRLTEEMGTLVPSNEVTSLKKLFQENATNNLHMTQQLLKVLDLLGDAGIEAIPLKGPILALQAYRDLSMRCFVDLDILIRAKDFEKMYNILLTHGFTPYGSVDTDIKKKVTILHKGLPFFGNDFSLDMQWKIAERFLSIPLTIDDLWDRSQLNYFFNREIRTLSREDALIITSIHGTIHYWHSLKWIADISTQINHSDFKWDDVIFRAEEIGVKRILFLGLMLAKEVGGIKYKSEIENVLTSDEKIEILVDEVKKNLFYPRKGIRFFTPPRFYLTSRERINDKMNFIFYFFIDKITLPNYRDFNVIRLPSYLFPFYSIIRLFRLMKLSVEYDIL